LEHQPAPPYIRPSSCLGVDLDLTLLDTRTATAVALDRVNAHLGTAVDVDAFVARLGPPIRQELARWIPDDRIEEAVGEFRRCFVTEGLPHLRALPGATDLVSRIRAGGGRIIVITSRIPAIAHACLESCQLDVAAVVGGVSGEEKSPAMTAHGVDAYIGDHPLDMLGAARAGVPGVGVTTGAHDEAELHDAGATHVVSGLDVVVTWLGRAQV